jgi:uncharacterized protein YfiM (DUF2279 family)
MVYRLPTPLSFNRQRSPGWWIFLLLFISLVGARAQSTDTSGAVRPNRKRIALVVAGTATAYTGTMIGLSQVWYSQYAHQSFRFYNDINEWKQMDKFGHFYSAFQIAGIGSGLLRWGDLPKKKSDRIAAITSLLIMSSIEVFDGFSAAYGASVTDVLANACGATFYLGQNLAWKEVRIYPKFSFHHTALAAVNPNELGGTLSQQLIKDYNGQTYWVSVDMDKFVRFPRWLNLCVGYGAQNMVDALEYQSLQKGYKPYRQYYLGLDFDLTAYRSKSKFLNTLIYFVNMIRLPAPALEFSQGKFRAHGLYF